MIPNAGPAQAAAGSGATIHASAVAHCGRGCLILGRAGSGKTTLALEMMALGAVLIADDRVRLTRAGARLALAPPPQLAGLIEIRGAGILRVARHAAGVDLWLAADLDRAAPERMPPAAETVVRGVAVPSIPCRGRPAAAASLMAILAAGRLPDPEFLPDPEAPADPEPPADGGAS